MGVKKSSSKTWKEQLESVRPKVCGTPHTDNPSKELAMQQPKDGPGPSLTKEPLEVENNAVKVKGNRLIVKTPTGIVEIELDENLRERVVANVLTQQQESTRAVRAAFWTAIGMTTLSVVGSIVLALGGIMSMTGGGGHSAPDL